MENTAKKMKMHITITNNETGEVIAEHDTNAIVAGIDLENGTRSLVKANCDPIAFACALHAAQGAVDKTLDENKKLAALYYMMGAFNEKTEEENTEKGE